MIIPVGATLRGRPQKQQKTLVRIYDIINNMKNLYKELNNILGGSPVVELKEVAKEKELKAALLLKCGNGSCDSDVLKNIVDDKRIKALVADIDLFASGNSALSEAVKLLKINIPDVKVFAAGADMTDIPDICTGFLNTEPANAGLTVKMLSSVEGMKLTADSDEEKNISKAGAILAAAITLAKKEDFEGFNILVYLPDVHLA